MENVTRLLRLMDEQQTNYERLHDLLARKRAAIETNDLPLLARAAHEIERLIGENNRVEEARQGEARMLAAQLGVPGRQPRLAQLLPRLPEPERTALAERRTRLHTVLRELKVESGTIHGVLKLNLKLIDQLFRTMLSAVPEAETYQQSGLAGARDTLRLLDRTA